MAQFETDMRSRMSKSIDVLRHDLGGLRTGRASIDLLTPVMVESYGQMMPLNQVGTVSASDARTLTVQVWDKSQVSSVEKAIRDANLGLNPSADGQMVRVSVPVLTEDRRKDLVKVARQYAEKARVSVRNVRREIMDEMKKLQKDGVISEDESRRNSDVIQKVTDEYVAQVDDALATKEKDIAHV